MEQVIAVAMGIDRLPVFGVSGGGPHALAFAARFPALVTRVATVYSPAPRDADGLGWTNGMMERNRDSAAGTAGPRRQARSLLQKIDDTIKWRTVNHLVEG